MHLLCHKTGLIVRLPIYFGKLFFLSDPMKERSRKILKLLAILKKGAKCLPYK